MPAQVKAWPQNYSGRGVGCKTPNIAAASTEGPVPRPKYLRYGFGDSDGAAFLLKMSGSCVSLKLAGTVNSLSAIESRLTPVSVLVISIGCPEALAPCSSAWFFLAPCSSAGLFLPTVMHIRIGRPGKSRKSGIFVLAASHNSDL